MRIGIERPDMAKKAMAIPVVAVTAAIALLYLGWAICDRGKAGGAVEATTATKLEFLIAKDVIHDEQLNHLDEAIHSIQTDLALISRNITSMAESMGGGEP